MFWVFKINPKISNQQHYDMFDYLHELDIAELKEYAVQLRNHYQKSLL